MRSTIVIFLCSIIFSNAHAQFPSFEWAKAIGTTYSQFGKSIAVDDSGNVYTMGNFTLTVDFDPGPGVFNMSSSGFGSAVFIQKLDVNGNFVWAKEIDGDCCPSGQNFTIDSLGNLYITGSFRKFVDFDPGPGTHTIYAWSNSMFILKLDRNGSFIWVKPIYDSGSSGANTSVTSLGMVLDDAFNLYITGAFQGTVDFDPSVNNQFLTPQNNNDGFVMKLDSAGNLVWVKQIKSSSWFSSNGIALDDQNNSYLCGYFYGDADFNPGLDSTILTSAFNHDLFVLKLDVNGNFIWVKQVVGNSFNNATDIEIDLFGNPIIVGEIDDTTDFNPGPNPTVILPEGTSDAFLLKLDSSGQFKWVKQYSGPDGGASVKDIELDMAGNIYSTGTFSGTCDFDPSTNSFQLKTEQAWDSDFFLQKLDSTGFHLWTISFGDLNNDVGNKVYIDPSNNIYTTGAFGGFPDFDPGIDTFIVSYFSHTDIFTYKLSQTISACNFNEAIWTVNNTDICQGESSTLQSVNVTGASYQWLKYGNPISGATSNTYTANKTGNYRVQITDLFGCTKTSNPIKITKHGRPPASIVMNGTVPICVGDSVQLQANTGPFTYQWIRNSKIQTGASDSVFYAKSAGNHKALVTDTNGCFRTSNKIVVTRFPRVQASVTPSGTVVICPPDSIELTSAVSAGAAPFTYQWIRYNTPQAGETNANIYAKTFGGYKVVVTDANGCTDKTSSTVVSEVCRTADNISSLQHVFEMNVLPNPFDQILNVDVRTLSNENILVRIYDALGQIIFEQENHSEFKWSISTENVQYGIYFIQVKQGKRTIWQKVIK